MGRRKKQQADSDAPLIMTSEGGEQYVLRELPRDEQGPSKPDAVSQLLGSQFDPEIVQEIRSLDAPAWEAEDSSLDPIDDLSDYAMHGFRLPPKDYADVQAAAEELVDELEALRAPPDEATAAAIRAREALVEGRSDRDIAWLKHKAYARATAALRAKRHAREEAGAGGGDGAGPSGREALLAAKGAPLDVVPAQLIDMAPAEAAARLAAEAEAAAAAAAAGSSGGGGSGDLDGWSRADQPAFDEAWLSRDYRRHPVVLGMLAAGLGSALGAEVWPDASPAAAAVAERAREEVVVAALGGPAAVERLARDDVAAAVAAARDQAWRDTVKEAATLERGARPVAQFTPEHRARVARERAAARYRTARSAAFFLGFAGTLGLSAVRWWRERQRRAARAADAAAASRARSARRGRAGSVASSEATLPAVLEAA
ncbi:hypothetical protein Rsub_11271 [Raphidocelis subcapitata]|uniref:Uncharacterized protein n=1 Tax=Raphidocelis subcapitata TaxID=307507 RepID=A0A2V0PI76_9CHLO|nr:hypothetical protein Rsub_11271 [Raphidocelis subcapitata]|eukprot:GBF98722.1 hypothetical protein Rsub_11271 [Raphidocelis subcapitata]